MGSADELKGTYNWLLGRTKDTAFQSPGGRRDTLSLLVGLRSKVAVAARTDNGNLAKDVDRLIRDFCRKTGLQDEN